jgi:hypothetical protein
MVTKLGICTGSIARIPSTDMRAAVGLAGIIAIERRGPIADRMSPRPQGLYPVRLPRGVLDRLKAMRGPAESYSAVILSLATAQ